MWGSLAGIVALVQCLGGLLALVDTALGGLFLGSAYCIHSSTGHLSKPLYRPCFNRGLVSGWCSPEF